MTAARLRKLELVLPCLTLGLLLIAMVGRLFCDAELEWMEGAMLDVVRRIDAGQAIYAEPSLSGASFVYPPLHYGVAWLSTQLFGLGFVALRIPSVLATLGSLALLFDLGRRAGGSARAGLYSAALYAASYEVSGRWLDLGRVDALQVFCVLGTVRLLLARPRFASDLAVGLALALAFACKQTSLVLLAPLLAWLLARTPGRGLRVAIFFALPSLIAHLWLEHTSDGWYGFYVYQVPAAHPWHPESWLEFWRGDLALGLPVLILLALVAAWTTRARDGGSFLWLLLGAVLASYLSRLHWGGWKNVLLPLWAIAAFGVGRLLAELEARAAPARLRGLVAVLLLAQLAWQLPRPWDAIPGAEHETRWNRIAEQLQALEGPILLPDHGDVLARAGHAPSIHTVAIWDLLLTLPELRGEAPSPDGTASHVQKVARRFLAEARRLLTEAHFAQIVLGTDDLDAKIPGAAWRSAYRLGAVLLPELGTTPPPRYAGNSVMPIYPRLILQRKD